MPSVVHVRCIATNLYSYCDIKTPHTCAAADITRPCRIYAVVDPRGIATQHPPLTQQACYACAADRFASGAWTLHLAQRAAPPPA